MLNVFHTDIFIQTFLVLCKQKHLIMYAVYIELQLNSEFHP